MKITKEYLRQIIRESIEEVDSPFKGVKKGSMSPDAKASMLAKTAATKARSRADLEKWNSDYESRKASGEFSDENMVRGALEDSLDSLGDGARRIFEQHEEEIMQELLRAYDSSLHGGGRGVSTTQVARILFQYV